MPMQRMILNAGLVIGCVWVVFGHPEPGKKTGPLACRPEFNVIKEYNMKKGKGGIPRPNLEGIFKYIIIYDDIYMNTERDSQMCFATMFSKINDDQDKIHAKSTIHTKTLSMKHGSPFANALEIDEYAHKASRDGLYWAFHGKMKIENYDAEPLSYDGDYYFFHNKDGIVGHSACITDKNGKGFVLVISKDNSASSLDLLRPESKAFRSFIEAKTKLEDIAKILYKKSRKDIVKHEFKTSPLCW